MSDWIYAPPDNRDGVTIPTIWIAVVVSLLLHLAAMWHWLPRLQVPSLAEPASDALVVRLSPPPGAPPASAPPPPQPAPAPPSVRPSSKTRAQQPAASAVRPPPVLQQPLPSAPSQPMTVPESRPSNDFASYVNARRLARNDAAPPATSAAQPAQSPEVPPIEDENTRRMRIATANLAQQPLPFGYDPSKSGGVFEIKRVGYYNAEFMFYGWNTEIRHNTAQLIEVSKGNNSDIRLAVVRRMIAIIRDHVREDFEWRSRRLGHDITLSARLRDNAGLEDFLMQEFFYDARPAQ